MENQTIPQENKMGVMPIDRLLLSMSLPMMISMLVQALYNIVDSIFVSRINEYALRAVSLAFPIQSLMIAVSVGTAVGINAFLSRTLGEKEYQKANTIAANGVFVELMSYVVFALVGIFASRPFFASQTAIEQVREYGTTYLTICCTAGIGIFMQVTFERLLQSTGRTFYAMITQGVGAIINLIMDPILIFGYFGMPEMGVAGAAAATVLGQIAAAVLAIVFNVKVNREIHLSFRGFRPDKKLIAGIYRVGIPSIIMQSIGSVMTYCMNKILIDFSSTAAAVFGVYFKLQSFFFMPVFGLNNGITPIIAYSYGAQQRKRMVKTIKISMGIAFGLLLVGFAGFELVPQVLLRMFDASEEMMDIGCQALRIIGFHFLVAWFCVIALTIFQALGKAVYSMIVSIMRQLVVLVPAAYILARIGGLDAVWWAFPIAETVSLLVSVLCLVSVYKKIIKPLPEGRE